MEFIQKIITWFEVDTIKIKHGSTPFHRGNEVLEDFKLNVNAAEVF